MFPATKPLAFPLMKAFIKKQIQRAIVKLAKPFAPRFPENQNNQNRKTIVVFNDKLPQPEKDSGSVRLFEILKILAGEFDVCFVPVTFSVRALFDKSLSKIGVKVISFIEWQKEFKTKKINIAVLSRPQVAEIVLPQIRQFDENIKIIFDTVDVHFVRFQREFELTNNRSFAAEAEQFKKLETSLADLSDEVWCVTAADVEFLDETAPPTQKIVIPNIHKMGTRGKPFAERSGIMFLGSYLHRPNIDAVFYFLREIFPLVCKDLPDAKFHVVGSHPAAEILQAESESENVIVRGFVEDVAPLFEDCRVFVAPLRYGAGMKGKIGHALSFGVPTVTTKIGAEGMNLTDKKELLIADKPKEFAEAIIKLYRNEQLWQSLSDAGYKFIEENYSPEIIKHKILSSVENLLEK